MIDVKKTILNTIVNQVNEMRFHAHNDPKCWRKLIYLAMLDDLYDWSYYKNDSTEILLKLKLLRTDFIIKNPMFGIVHVNCPVVSYTNVNTPLTNIERIRLFGHDITNGVEIPQENELKYTPDYNCTRLLIQLPYSDKIIIGEDGPIVKKPLTICEKMNIYINQEENKAYYLTTEGKWQLLNTNGEMEEKDVIELITKYSNKGVSVKFEGTDISYLQLDTPSEDGNPGKIQVLDSDDESILNDMFK